MKYKWIHYQVINERIVYICNELIYYSVDVK